MSSKILHFFILCVLFYEFKYSESNSEKNVLLAMFIDNNSSDIYCVTNTTKAIYFNEFTKIISEFYPKPKIQFSCNLNEKNNKCVTLWWKSPWAIYSLGQILLDWRWERLETIQLRPSLLHPIVTITGVKFETYFSIRNKCGSIFFLCDNNRVSLSSLCYKFTLQTCFNSVSTIEACRANLQNVDTYSTNIQNNFCLNPIVISTTNHWRGLDANRWRHILIQRNNKYLAIMEYKNGVHVPIISIIIENELKDGTRIFSSSLNYSFLKFHFNSYLHSYKESSMKLGPKLSTRNHELCISILSKMCNQCSISLKLTDTISNQVIYEEDLQYTTWNEKKIVLRNISSQTLELTVETKLLNGTSEKFWAIDGIRDCKENEFRIVNHHFFEDFDYDPICRTLENDDLLPTRLQIDCTEDISAEQCLINKILRFNQIKTSDNFNQQPFHDIVILVVIILSIIITIIIFLLYKYRKLYFKRHDNSYITPVSYRKSTFIRRYLRNETETNPKTIRIENLPEYVEDIFKNEPVYYAIPENESEYFERPSIYSLNGYKCPKAFVVIENSNSILKPYFWKIVWRDNIETIVWITNETGHVNDKKLFPDTVNDSLIIGEVLIKLLPTRSTTDDCKYRQYLIQRKSKQRKLVQILMDTSLDDLQIQQNFAIISKKLLKQTVDSRSPVLLHGSNITNIELFPALVLVDSCLRMASRKGVINIDKQLQYCYQQFPQLINNAKFYQICHLILVECWNSIEKPFDCYEIDNFDCDFIKLQIRKIIHIHSKSKNSNNYTNNQINIVNFYQTQILITPQPARNELDEFWRRIILDRIPLIITLNTTNDTEKLMGQQVMTPLGAVTLKHQNTEHFNSFKRIFLEISLTGTSDLFRIEINENSGWSTEEILPKDIKSFLLFCQESFKSFRRTNSLLLTCQDIYYGSGIYLALFYILESIQTNFICNISGAIQDIQNICPELHYDESAIKFLYQCVQVYLKEFENYANFN